MNKVTIVSALFVIDRVDGRKWGEYLKCFYIIVALAFVLTGCASVLPGKDKAHTQTIKNRLSFIQAKYLKKNLQIINIHPTFQQSQLDTSMFMTL